MFTRDFFADTFYAPRYFTKSGSESSDIPQVSSPVAADGSIATIIIGDDYLAANGRAFQWTITKPTGCVASTSSCHFGGKDKAGTTWLVQGTIADNGATWTLSFDLPRTATASMVCGIVRWSFEVRNAAASQLTIIRTSEQDDPTLLVEKYT